MNSKLAGTTMSKISFEGVVALKRAGLVLRFEQYTSARLSPEDEQSTLVSIILLGLHVAILLC